MILVLMGTAGSGKTTVGIELAGRTGWLFVDGDDFHSQANQQKMRRGVPLDDSDRDTWLNSLRSAIDAWIDQRRNVVLGCSALKRSYRDRLRVGPEVRFVYLKGDFDLIDQRLRARQGHFAGEELLPSQFEALEEPDPDERAIVVEVDQTPQEVVRRVLSQLGFNSSTA